MTREENISDSISMRKKHLYILLALLLWVFPVSNAQSAPRVSPEEILKTMTLDEKVGQLFIVWFKGGEMSPFLQKAIGEYHVGGLIFYSITGNTKSPEQITTLSTAAQRLALRTGADLGLFMSIDQEGGPVTRLTKGFTVLPSNLSIGHTDTAISASRAATLLAQEMTAVGLNMNFAPSVDVNSNPDNPIIGTRSFGSDPNVVARFGRAAVDAYVAQKVIPVLKHFPGHGDTSVDSHNAMPVVPHSLARLQQTELAPFSALAEDAPAIMTAHLFVPALDPTPNQPATFSHKILTELLRKKMGFNGLIITDSLGMGAIANTYGSGQAAVRAFKAGADILLFGADKGHEPEEALAAIRTVRDAVKNGKISEVRLNASVLRILKTKKAYNILSPSFQSPLAASHMVGTPKHRAAALMLARKGTKILRDTHKQLPIRGAIPPAVITFGDTPSQQTVEASFPAGTGLIKLPRRPSQELILRVLKHLRDADCIVLTRKTAKAPEQLELVRALESRNAGKLYVATLGTADAILNKTAAPCVIASGSSTPEAIRAIAELLFASATQVR